MDDYIINMIIAESFDIAVREESHIDFVHEKRHENFDSLMKIFNVLKSSKQSIQNPAFS